MRASTDEQSELGSVSDEHPLSGLLDDLYYLKCSLIKNDKLSDDSMSFFQQICNLLETKPELRKVIFKWKFLEKELLYFLRTNRFIDAIIAATLIINECKAAPDMYFTRKFLFCITDKLYFAMNKQKCTTCNINEYTLPSDFICNDLIEMNSVGNMENLKSSQIDEFKFSAMPDLKYIENDKMDYTSVKAIMLFVKSLISIKRTVAVTLADLMFFELANECICTETAQMFNTIFINLTYPCNKIEVENKSKWTQDGLYEINRSGFDPEIVFRNKDVFSVTSVVENLASGVYANIYNQCTNLRNFADILPEECIDILLYKRTSYWTPECEDLFIKSKDSRVFRLYRRALESSVTPSQPILNTLIKGLDNDTCREAAISLYYYIDIITPNRLLTESRVRRIFECLESKCEHECTKKTESTSNCCSKTKKAQETQEEAVGTFNSNEMTNQIFGMTENERLYNTPIISKKADLKSILETFSEFENEFDVNSSEEPVQSLYICERKRILLLIKHMYTILNKHWFYKPSYLILLSFSMTHCPEESIFILTFFKDFLKYCKDNRKNIGKVFLSNNHRDKAEKTVEYKMDELDDDFYGIRTVLNEQQKDKEEVEDKSEEDLTLKIEKNIKRSRNVIESTEE